MTAPWTVNMRGLGDFANRVKRFDTDVAKHLRDDISLAVDGIYKNTQQQIEATGNPLSRWGSWSHKRVVTSRRGLRNHPRGSYVRDLSYDPAQVKGGIKKRMRVVNKSDAQDVQGIVADTTAAGAIYELAGSKNRSGNIFNRNLITKHPSRRWPRVLGPAWADGNDKAVQLLTAAVSRAVITVNQG